MKRLSFLTQVLAVWCRTYIAQNAEDRNHSHYQETEQPQIKLFPNPASDAFDLRGLVNSSKANISITELLRNTVQEYQWENRNNAMNLLNSFLIPGN